MDDRHTLTEAVRMELRRVGALFPAVQSLASIHAVVTEGASGLFLRAWDDAADMRVDPVQAIEALRALPNGAGLEAAWRALESAGPPVAGEGGA